MIAHPYRGRQKQQERDNRRQCAIDDALNHKWSADILVLCPHEPHDADLFASEVDRQADSVERDDDRNDDESLPENTLPILGSFSKVVSKTGPV